MQGSEGHFLPSTISVSLFVVDVVGFVVVVDVVVMVVVVVVMVVVVVDVVKEWFSKSASSTLFSTKAGCFCQQL